MGKLWEVIGGAEKGGILVRQGADCWAGRFETGVIFYTCWLWNLSIKKAYRNGGIFLKNPIEFHGNCDGITIWYCALPYSMFEHKHVYCMVFWTCPHTMCRLGTALPVVLLCAVCSQNCVQVFNLWFALICNISISVHVATEFRWFIEHAGVAIKLVSKIDCLLIGSTQHLPYNLVIMMKANTHWFFFGWFLPRVALFCVDMSLACQRLRTLYPCRRRATVHRRCCVLPVGRRRVSGRNSW